MANEPQLEHQRRLDKERAEFCGKAVLWIIAGFVVWMFLGNCGVPTPISIGDRLINGPKVVATPTEAEWCRLDPTTCYLDFELAEDEWRARQLRGDE